MLRLICIMPCFAKFSCSEFKYLVGRVAAAKPARSNCIEERSGMHKNTDDVNALVGTDGHCEPSRPINWATEILSSDRDGSLHLHVSHCVHCRSIGVHADAFQGRRARSGRRAVAAEETAHEAAVLSAGVLILKDALGLRVGHTLREILRATSRGIARCSAQLAAPIEITGDLVIEARRSTIVGLTRSGCWRWCRRRSWRWRSWCRG